MRARAVAARRGLTAPQNESLILFVIFHPKGSAPRAAEGAFPSTACCERVTSASQKSKTPLPIEIGSIYSRGRQETGKRTLPPKM
jgi:hypothetical protein